MRISDWSSDVGSSELGARRLWRKTGRPKRSGRTDDRLSLRPSLSPQLRAARRRSSAFRAIAIKLSIPHHAAILGRVPIEAKQLTSMTITQDADLRLQARPLF